MGLIILCFIVPFIITIVLAIKDRDGELIVFGLFGSLLLGLIGTLIAFVGGILVETDKVYNTETTNLCAFSDFNGTHGSYFLGYGNSKSKMYYCYLTEDEDHAKIMHTLDANGVKIYDNEKETPRIVTEYKTNSNPFAAFFLLPFSESTAVYVPEGTIKYNYNVDLE